MQVIDSANEIKERATDWFEHASDYFEARWKLGVLDASEKTAGIISSLASVLIIATVGTFALLFASIGIAWLIGEKLGSPAMGYFIVAAFYAVVGGILFAVKDALIKVPIVNSFIKKFYYENGNSKY
ncbi:MAG: phage holin family protein [Spirosomataceae bacterium]